MAAGRFLRRASFINSTKMSYKNESASWLPESANGLHGSACGSAQMAVSRGVVIYTYSLFWRIFQKKFSKLFTYVVFVTHKSVCNT